MHKKFLAFCLPILGSAVIVGAGFSAWAFNETTTDAISGTITVTDAVQGLTAKIYKSDTTEDLENVVLTLDQDGISNAADDTKGAETDYSSYDLAVSFATTTDGFVSLLDSHNLVLTYAVAVTSEYEAFSQYVELTTGDAEGGSATITSSNFSSNPAVGQTVHTFNVPLTWKYVDDKKPQTYADYYVMDQALAISGTAFTVTVTVTAEWTAK